MTENECYLDSVPQEILEQFISYLSPQEICETIRQVNRRFYIAANNVLFVRFKELGPIIISQLNEAKKQLNLLDKEIMGNQETEIIFVAQYTFLQIMYSEYHVINSIFLDQLFDFSNLLLQSVESMQEFQRLLNGSAMNQWDWRAGNVSTTMTHLRNLNSRIIDCYFSQLWDSHQEHFGPMVLRLMNCSLCANYSITITHEEEMKSQESKCHFFGKFEIPDFSHTLVSPPGGLQDRGIVALISYICNTIRRSNMFHTLRLRWVCMDRALAIGRRQRPLWPFLDNGNPYISNISRAESETIRELRNGERKVCKVIKRSSENPLLPSWVGIKCEFQLWCPISQAPMELMGDNYIKMFEELPETSVLASSCTRPYHFKMEFKSYVKELAPGNRGLLESTVWVEETQQSIRITQSKQRVS